MLLRPEGSRGPRPAPIAVSLVAHMSLLATVALGPAPAPKAQSAYQREIAPHEKKLVWYRFNEKLPEVSPTESKADPRPPRALVKHPKQTIVSRAPKADPATQTILTPGPELKIEHELQAPNLMAFEAKPPEPAPKPKLFVPPPPQERAMEETKLERGPELAAAPAELPAMPVSKPAPKKFTPPPQAARRMESTELQPGDARIEPAPLKQLPTAQIAGPPRPRPKAFVPPPKVERAGAVTLPSLPSSGPQISTSTLMASVPVEIKAPMKPQPKTFTAPAPKAAPRREAPVLAAAPSLGQTADAAAGAGLPTRIAAPAKPQPRAFSAPRAEAPPPATPALEAPGANLTAAVVGLNPIDSPVPLIPEGSRPAQFSAAPEIARKGGAGGPVDSAGIVMPDLMIRGEGVPKRESIASLARVAPTSRENLLAAGRPVITADAPAAAPPAAPKSLKGAVRVASGPNREFDGRAVFTVALQMPNVTSYSGSWILWYSERKAMAAAGEADIQPPTALRKVDPVYDLSAVDDRVEGKVQLGAIIHTDGFVYGITVLRGVDPRLDNSAIAALRKWEFEPARREGAPVDVDIVIEIPFRLRPPFKK
ncbi:MAG TPA: TonB family protein [Bryobacteraceae bacterium]|nr:TonB family protein [Bryobacteraceae bacterium]